MKPHVRSIVQALLHDLAVLKRRPGANSAPSESGHIAAFDTDIQQDLASYGFADEPSRAEPGHDHA
jgi:hypothetical protein